MPREIVPIEVPPEGYEVGRPVGVAELAEWIGVRDRTYLARGAGNRLPEPTYRLAAGPIWIVDDHLRSVVRLIRQTL